MRPPPIIGRRLLGLWPRTGREALRGPVPRCRPPCGTRTRRRGQPGPRQGPRLGVYEFGERSVDRLWDLGRKAFPVRVRQCRPGRCELAESFRAALLLAGDLLRTLTSTEGLELGACDPPGGGAARARNRSRQAPLPHQVHRAGVRDAKFGGHLLDREHLVAVHKASVGQVPARRFENTKAQPPTGSSAGRDAMPSGRSRRQGFARSSDPCGRAH